MRHLPPRMSNQPARKAWEIEATNGEIFSSKHAENTLDHSHPYHTTRAHKTSHATASYILPPDFHRNRNQRLYDDTGNRIAYRGGFMGRGGKGWGL